MGRLYLISRKAQQGPQVLFLPNHTPCRLNCYSSGSMPGPEFAIGRSSKDFGSLQLGILRRR